MDTHYIEQIEYTRGSRIGAGAFGEVFKAYGERGYETYALKEIKCTKDEDLNDVVEEIRALGGLKHQNIVALYNVKATQVMKFEAILSLLLEYCAGGDLNERLSRDSSEATNLQWMRQIANAVDYLHTKNIIHRDLKPQNILLTLDDDIKIADFGLATHFARRNDNQSWLKYYIELGVGAACYVAPEMISLQVLPVHYTYKVDIFAVGIIFYAIIERTFLQVVSEGKCYGIFVPVETGNRQPLGIHMFNIKTNVEIAFTQTNVITRIVKKALDYNYKKRPKAQEIKLALERYRPNKACVLL